MPVQGFDFVILLKQRTFDLGLLSFLVISLLAFHAVVSMTVTRIIGGGNWAGGLTHLVGIMWVIAIAAVVTKYLIVRLF